MTAKESQTQQMSMKNTKQELLAAYNELLRKIEEEQKKELKPEKKVKEKEKDKILSAVSKVSAEGVVQDISKLKVDIGKILSQVSDKLESEVQKLEQIQNAIEIKEQELKEIYEIDKSAATLAALIETQHQERKKFEDEMAKQKEDLLREIGDIRKQWQIEKQKYEAEVKERKALEAKKQEREKEEFRYSFEREKQLDKDKFEDEKAAAMAEKQRIEMEMKALKEQTEKELQEREKAIAEKEQEFALLQAQVDEFPKKLDLAIANAIKETTQRIQTESKYEKDLLGKQFEGEKNVLTARIESLDKTVKEQNERIAKLSKQQELAYQKVQDVAVKAIEGASKVGSFSGVQQVLAEQSRKQNSDG